MTVMTASPSRADHVPVEVNHVVKNVVMPPLITAAATKARVKR